VRGRADRQSRLVDERRDPHADARIRGCLSTDDRDGDARSSRRGDRRPDPLPGRRTDCQGARPVRPTRCDHGHGGSRGRVIGVTLKGLAGRRLRALLTALAIVLGVAMMSGTFILTDTINGAFTSIFTESYKNADAVISGRTAFTNHNGNAVQAPSLPQSLVAKVKALPDVQAAAGSVSDDRTKLVGRNGKVITSGGAPQLAFSVDPTSDQRFNPLVLTAGTWPRGPDQVAIDSHV